MMNKRIVSGVMIFTISTSMITIISTGIWLLNQPSDLCLGDKSAQYDGRGEFTSIIYVGAGLCLMFTVVCLFAMPVRPSWRKYGEYGDQRMIIAVTCFGVQLLLLILFASLYALTQSTVGFVALQRWIYSPERWINIKDCLYEDSNVCARFQNKYGDDTQHQFFGRYLTPLEVCTYCF